MKKGKSMAVLLSAAMLVTPLSPLTVEAAEGLTGQVLNLSFDGSLEDVGGAHGVTMGKGAENYVEGIKGQGLSLDGMGKAMSSWERKKTSSRRISPCHSG